MLHLTKFSEAMKERGLKSIKADNLSFEISRLFMQYGITKSSDIEIIQSALKEANSNSLTVEREILTQQNFNQLNV